MNKKTYGDGTRFERTDHTVVAETMAAKEKLRDQLGEGEGVRVEELSRVEFLERQMQDAVRLCEATAEAVSVTLEAHRDALVKYQEAAREYLAAKAEEEQGQ